MANTSQAPDLDGLHREIHNIVEQIRIMNQNNARLIQHLPTNNLPPPLYHLSQKLNDLVVLVGRATTSLKVTEVRIGHIQIEISIINH